MTYVKDIGWLLLLGLLSPLLMVLALAGLAFVVGRHLYWWTTRHRIARPGTRGGAAPGSATTAG